ncbi:MAG: trehalose-6-phosphate synthase [Anaerolineae bacterium]|nr:trehalose-6-phosphate synthase [Anaerolineae bacterium]
MKEIKREKRQKPLIVIASNRGPFSFQQEENGSFTVRRGSGGLVTALGSLAERYQVLWVAAAMSDEDRRWAQSNEEKIQHVEGIYLRLIQPDPDAYELYYNQIANPLLWFIQHQLWDIPRSPTINAETWQAWRDGYAAVNRQFAETIADSVKHTDHPVIVFPQDYHLYLVSGYLRQMLGDRVQIQPFLHIPWPGPDAWRILPKGMRDAMLYSLLGSDRIGFQTQRDAFNFVQTCRFYLPDAHSLGSRNSINYAGRKIEAKAYPISVDVEQLESLVEEPEVRLLRSQVLNNTGDRKLILRVDRVEPSKNILRSLVAYRALLENHPEHHDRVQMLALLVPSRMEVYEYQNYLREIMAEAGMINAEFSDELWEPVRVVVGENYHRAVAALQLYDVLMVNPLADGMNLVAKEGVLVNQRDGVLLLSEDAGAFYELGEHALIVPPFDIYSTMEAIHEALNMSEDERHRRAEALRELVRRSGVRRWFQHQVEDAMQALR